jgi:hypothetical protein
MGRFSGGEMIVALEIGYCCFGLFSKFSLSRFVIVRRTGGFMLG